MTTNNQAGTSIFLSHRSQQWDQREEMEPRSPIGGIAPQLYDWDDTKWVCGWRGVEAPQHLGDNPLCYDYERWQKQGGKSTAWSTRWRPAED